jgi:hypothetical protein
VALDRETHLVVSTHSVHTASVLAAAGVLDSSSLRDTITKAALDAPCAVIVDVTRLYVPVPSVWAVLTSAHWYVSRNWPFIPMMLACQHVVGRQTLAAKGITHYMPVYPGIGSAIEALLTASPGQRQRDHVALPALPASIAHARFFVADCLDRWSVAELIPEAKLVVTVLVENVLTHTDSAPHVMVETDSVAVTVAVRDSSTTPATRRETTTGGIPPTYGLNVLAALSKAWGNMPTASGKTVWAVISGSVLSS